MESTNCQQNFNHPRLSVDSRMPCALISIPVAFIIFKLRERRSGWKLNDKLQSRNFHLESNFSFKLCSINDLSGWQLSMIQWMTKLFNWMLISWFFSGPAETSWVKFRIPRTRFLLILSSPSSDYAWFDNKHSPLTAQTSPIFFIFFSPLRGIS